MARLWRVGLRKVLHHLDEFSPGESAVPAELQELDCLGEDCSAFGCASNAHAVSRAEFEKPLVAQHSHGTQDRVGVDLHNRREVACGWESFSGLGLAISDRTADLRGDLVVQQCRVGAIDLQTEHCATNNSSMQLQKEPGTQWQRL